MADFDGEYLVGTTDEFIEDGTSGAFGGELLTLAGPLPDPPPPPSYPQKFNPGQDVP